MAGSIIQPHRLTEQRHNTKQHFCQTSWKTTMGKSKFTVGDVIMLEDLDTGKTCRYTIQSREEKRAILISKAGKIKRATILQVSIPNGECLDVEGFNAVFSQDIKDTERLDINKDIDKLRELIEQGVTMGQLRGRFRVGWETLKRVMKENGFSAQTPADPRKREWVSSKSRELERHSDEIRKMIAAGESIAKIAQKFGVSTYLISHFRRDQHMPPRSNHTQIIRDNFDEVYKMVKAGAFLSEIAARFGVKKYTVRNVLNENGMDMKHNSGRNAKTRVRCVDRKD